MSRDRDLCTKAADRRITAISLPAAIASKAHNINILLLGFRGTSDLFNM